jgi:hypothetical protein
MPPGVHRCFPQVPPPLKAEATRRLASIWQSGGEHEAHGRIGALPCTRVPSLGPATRKHGRLFPIQRPKKIHWGHSTVHVPVPEPDMLRSPKWGPTASPHPAKALSSAEPIAEVARAKAPARFSAILRRLEARYGGEILRILYVSPTHQCVCDQGQDYERGALIIRTGG